MNFEQAQILIAEAVALAKKDYGRPICVAVCDQYGFQIAFGRMEGAPIRSIAISQGKAYSAARMCIDTDKFLERLHRENVPASYFCDDKLTGLPGGCIVKNQQGQIVAAVGISGLAPTEDRAIAQALVAKAASF